jgi:lysyl-tRNA synthetase class 2
MASLRELRDSRLVKFEKLKALGIDPFPAISKKDTSNQNILQNYSEFEGKEVSVTGRIFSFRKHGKLSFIDLKDMSGSIQIVLKEESLKEFDPRYSELSYELLDLLDTGDFIEIHGTVFTTQRGEKSIDAKKVRILTKSLRPLPDAWDGLKDKETRLRRRYLDTTINEEVFQRFLRRAKFWEGTRLFFKNQGFYEINIPVLEQIPGGADANPFITHMDAIDQDFYLRISQELQLKRLIGGGYEKVYEIGPRFRNEGLSDEHLPEHIGMEFYWAYASWTEGMKFVKDMFDFVIEYVYGDKKVFSIKGMTVDFSKDWEIIDFNEVMNQRYGIDVHKSSLEEIREVLKKEKLPESDGANIQRAVDSLWKKIRKTVAGPAFLINHPKYISPLSKAKAEERHIAERFQPIIAGSELGNGWSENNSPIDQLEDFMVQQKLRDAGDAEAQWLDIDYVEMLEYGMPPTFGWGHSERVFWFLEDVTAREGVPFPQLKFELDESTREIYPFVNEIYEFKFKDRKKEGIVSTEKYDLITREEALDLLKKHVSDDYQLMHSKMVAQVLEKYAEKFGADRDLWYLTGLLHDLDYYEYPEIHPEMAIKWFEEKNFPKDLIHAVAAHAHTKTNVEPKTKLASCLLATDELCGFIWAYSLMRPGGFDGMEASSVMKKFKDKGFAAKIDREEIQTGVNYFGEDFKTHIEFVISVLKDFKND